MKEKSSQDAHLSGEITENNKNPSILDSFNQMSSGLKQVVDQWSQSAQALRKQFDQICEASNPVQQALSQKAQEIRTAIDNFFQPISEVVQRIRNIDPAFLEAIKQKLEQIVSDTKQVHSKLALRGWYLIASDQYITASDMISLTLLVETEDSDKIDDSMVR